MDMELTTRRRTARRGFSLIEATLAAALFLMIVIGILPLFTQATIQNLEGRESTGVANVARSRAEELLQLPFNSVPLTITNGTELQAVEYLVPDTDVWSTETPDSRLLWTRTTTVRQYNVSALDDGLLSATEALPAGSDPTLIHLKEIIVNVVAGREATAFGPQKSITVRVLKSK